MRPRRKLSVPTAPVPPSVDLTGGLALAGAKLDRIRRVAAALGRSVQTWFDLALERALRVDERRLGAEEGCHVPR